LERRHHLRIFRRDRKDDRLAEAGQRDSQDWGGTDTRKLSDGRPPAGSAFVEQAIGAQRYAVQRSQAISTQSGLAALLLMGIALFCVPSARAADGGAVVSGVVRDAQGVAQMGALVQVLAGDSWTVATAFTDAHGRYVIAHLHPGRYLVRASATLFVPATRTNLQLRAGATAVVNLTLAALFDTVQWLPAERRRADEPDDDWKWTLRSAANRPILRVVEDGTLIEVSSSASEAPAAEKMRARATVTSGDGEFGAGGTHNILAIHRSLDGGGDMTVRSDIGSTRVPAAAGPSQQFDAGMEKQQGFDGAARTVVSYKAHPELASAGMTTGFQAASVASAQRMSLGEVVAVEVGGRMQAVSAGETGFAARPFVRITTHPMGVWTLHYRMATDRTMQGFEDVTTGQSDVPVALVKNGKLELETGRHQEFAVDRKAGRGTVSVAYYHDSMGAVAVSGGGAAGPGETQASQIPVGMLVDPTTGSFRALASGYTTNGARITVSAPLADGLWVAAEYSTGDAIASESCGLEEFSAALANLRAQSAEAGTVALKGKIRGSGTRILTSYRWQPSRLVTAVDPYSMFSDQAFFSLQVRQPIQWGMRLPKGLDATIDVTNLLAQGYRPFISADGQTLYFAQSPRTIQGGVSFSF
jgi:hypothetical protein